MDLGLPFRVVASDESDVTDLMFDLKTASRTI